MNINIAITLLCFLIIIIAHCIRNLFRRYEMIINFIENSRELNQRLITGYIELAERLKKIENELERTKR